MSDPSKYNLPGLPSTAPVNSPAAYHRDITPSQAPSTGVSVVPSASSDVASGSSVVKMQSSLIELYDTLSSSIVKEWFGDDKQEPDEYSQQFRQGPSSFLKLLLNRYIDKAKINAKQFDLNMDDAKYYADPGQQKPHSSFIEYLDMLKTVGRHSTKEQVQRPDGQWGAYTDNAIKAAWSIGFSMVSITKRLGEKLSLTNNDLEKLSKLIHSRKTPQVAQQIASLVEKIKDASGEFVRLMLNANSKYGEYTTKDKKFDVFGPKGLSAEQQKQADQLMASNTLIPGLNKTFSGLSFKDIQSPESFAAWIKATKDGRMDVPAYLVELKKQLTQAVQSAGKQI